MLSVTVRPAPQRVCRPPLLRSAEHPADNSGLKAQADVQGLGVGELLIQIPQDPGRRRRGPFVVSCCLYRLKAKREAARTATGAGVPAGPAPSSG